MVTARTLFVAILDEVKQFQGSGEDHNLSGLRINLPFVPRVALVIACDLRPSGVAPSGRNCLIPTKPSFSNSLRLTPFLKSQVAECGGKIIHARVSEVNVVAVEEHSKHEHLSVPVSLDRLVRGEHLVNQMWQTGMFGQEPLQQPHSIVAPSTDKVNYTE
jgi:hypothetical protein